MVSFFMRPFGSASIFGPEGFFIRHNGFIDDQEYEVPQVFFHRNLFSTMLISFCDCIEWDTISQILISRVVEGMHNYFSIFLAIRGRIS